MGPVNSKARSGGPARRRDLASETAPPFLIELPPILYAVSFLFSNSPFQFLFR